MFKCAVHSGIFLKGELEELGVSPTEFARQTNLPPNRVSQIIAGIRKINGGSALSFGHLSGVDTRFWLNLQAQFELSSADHEVGARVRGLPTACHVRQAGEREDNSGEKTNA